MLKGHTKMCSLSPNFMSLEEKKQISLPQKLTIQQQQHQQYALKWSDYQSSILNCFQRLRDEEDFVDVTLSCDQRNFSAHRIVLSACSPYFRKLLKTNPCKHPIVILRDVHSDNMECLLSFMYNGEVNVRHDQLPDFLKTAHLLQIRGLTDVSENYYSSGCISSEGKSIDTLSANETCKLDSNRDVFEIESGEKCNYFPKYKGSSEPPMVSNSSSTGVNSTAIEDTETSTTACLQWENSDVFRNRKHHLTPPPHKRIKSADLFRAQHGISSDRALSEKEFSSFVHHSLARDRKHVEGSELKFGLVKDEKPQSLNQHIDIESKHEESADEESNRSNDDNSDHDDKTHGMKDSIGQQGAAVHSILLGGPKHMEQHPVINLNDFGSQRCVEIRVRATDPRPCPKCGKIYRSAHTLRTHLEDKHTACPGYRCVLCGTVAKSRNSLHSHMSRQHRGISTKDLPVLPMPCPFDPVLASRLLAKVGVKISPDELHDSASAANSNNASCPDYTYNSQYNIQPCGKNSESEDDAEDLTAATFCNTSTGDDTTPKSLMNSTTTARFQNEAAIAAAAAALRKHKELSVSQRTPNQPLLDLHLLQLITENTFGMGISQDRTSTATIQAAKMVQLNAIGKGFENLPSTMMHSKYNLSTESITKEAFVGNLSEEPNLSPEPILRHQLSCGVSLSENIQTLSSSTADMEHSFNDPKRDECESMQAAQMSASMGISQDRTSTATIQAAKMVQLNAIGKGFENFPSTMMHSKYNLSTESITKEAFVSNLSEKPNRSPEPILRHQLSCGVSLSENIQTLSSSTADMEHSFNDPKRDECESMQTAQMSASKLHSS
ncbi:protein abrupt-like isoform X2 [Eurosta solidaginis]|uniref:protein abrupt-like isoform X2 n=1 Tax=Eurosta solidaginis TaxID=178769 RepID=UPI0035313CDF